MKKVEETIKQLELILKARKEHKILMENTGRTCENCDPDIKALTESIDILSDYKKVLKENELLRQQNISYKNNINELKKNYTNIQENSNITSYKVIPTPESQLPTKTLYESFSKKRK